MAVTLRHERDNVYRMDVDGVLRQRDLDAAQRSAAAEIAERGRIRLLVVLARFEGWEPSADWRDLGFYIRHGDDVERIAIVGDERWRSEALMFAAADLRKASVEYFDEADAVRARTWLGE